jgi:iron complex transport system ATP-binding protein
MVSGISTHTQTTLVPSEPALEVRGLSAGYGRRTVLHDVSLTLSAGEVLGVIGANGSGKSTLVRSITRIVRPTRGDVLLGGRSTAATDRAAIARSVAVVPQGAALPAGFTGLEVVLLGRTPHLRLLQTEGPHDIAVASRALALCDATPFAARRIGDLSGGEQQRLLVARALAQEPRVLLLDEPTTYLDITHQVAILDLIRRLCRHDGLAALIVLHDLTLAAQFCDRLLLLSAGRIAAEGTPAEVLRPETLAREYGARVSVFAHPQTGRPVVVPLAAVGDGRLET